MPLAATRVWLPRNLHPGAWWVWALGLATAASRTTNPLLLAVIASVAGVVVMARRTDAPWARSYAAFLKLGLVVVAVRVVFHTLLGVDGPTTLVTLPEVPLPTWMAGIELGGPVSLEGLLAALYDGLRLATLLVCVGAANALANPSRLLRAIPGALYEVGVAVVVAMTLAPQLLQTVTRVRQAQRLRGRSDRGLRSLRRIAMPVLEGALERSLDLAAAMDARGYGRTAAVPAAARRLTAALTLGGLLGVCAGVYGLLDGGSPPLLGLPMLALGLVLAAAGFVLGGRRTIRTRYRPDPWGLPEWLVAGSGVIAAATLVIAAAAGVPGIQAPLAPPGWPVLPLIPTLGILVAVLPAWVAPRPPEPTARGGESSEARQQEPVVTR
jgi:energy-coupling factor transport system permease protein